MRLTNYKTSNPAFTDFFWNTRSDSDRKMSVFGIFLKSMFCILIIAGLTAFVWKLHSEGQNVRWFTLGGMISAIIISIVISVRKHWAPFLVPLYAIAKGFFLGGFSAYIKTKFPELPFQAIGVTIVTFFTVLILYQTRMIVVTKKLRSVIITSAVSIFVVYIISWILSFFGIRSFIWGTSWVAIVFNVIACIVASFTLLLDFDFIERRKNKAPKSLEWLATWGLLVSLVWLYTEILRLMRKLAIRF
ncbi:MAG: Bax inhibitor-1/YccA family protein [Bacteroidia bacterium]|nr:Bax inhibitor-1/YccA family protein [Bacteroidia bacterium]NND25541.1 Bax inhibitor-1/YccA family protein [Flavobacteriaceae bacterium]MBT8279164.1 Bax inhibitor-1/YccA family protein [Bacteroidia bacterium]NNK60852.1 Bax inhibitor-1/YccA family protein [Flavobacteriaceae bacterium]NNL33857.1 Bax inhibitor-1/YccA family protein [Flavobacteriaceae bacterium]